MEVGTGLLPTRAHYVQAAVNVQQRFSTLLQVNYQGPKPLKHEIRRKKMHARIWWAQLNIQVTCKAENYAQSWAYLEEVTTPP
jgi:hypothetical protein